MNVLDENVFAGQRMLLGKWRIPVRHIGHDLGRKAMSDEDIITLLHRLRKATFFTVIFIFTGEPCAMTAIAWSGSRLDRCELRSLFGACSDTASAIRRPNEWAQ